VTYKITARNALACVTYTAIGELGALMDAAYSAGALGVSAIRIN
jgi:hypothetical protein